MVDRKRFKDVCPLKNSSCGIIYHVNRINPYHRIEMKWLIVKVLKIFAHCRTLLEVSSMKDHGSDVLVVPCHHGSDDSNWRLRSCPNYPDDAGGITHREI
uniref:Ricin B lectin domain-containing protein n=1 Tax=Rhodnius prolixus TaxID=13249 RepID=T1HTM2_RHOPR